MQCEILRSMGLHVDCADFMDWTPPADVDRVAMNPPFSDGRWQAHVTRAAGMLADDGKLVAIVPVSAWGKFQIHGCSIEWVSQHEGAFDGTGVNVCIMEVVRK